MSAAKKEVPRGQGSPANFRPTMGLAHVVQALRWMMARMVAQDLRDKEAGKPANEHHAKLQQALQHAVCIINEVRYTGAVAPMWLADKGPQPELSLGGSVIDHPAKPGANPDLPASAQPSA